MSAVSSTLRAHYYMHSQESAISLSFDVLRFQLGFAPNRGGRNSVRPIHLFDHKRYHDYFFELPGQRGAGYPSIRSMTYCDAVAIPGLSRLRTELFELTVLPDPVFRPRASPYRLVFRLIHAAAIEYAKPTIIGPVTTNTLRQLVRSQFGPNNSPRGFTGYGLVAASS